MELINNLNYSKIKYYEKIINNNNYIGFNYYEIEMLYIIIDIILYMSKGLMLLKILFKINLRVLKLLILTIL